MAPRKKAPVEEAPQAQTAQSRYDQLSTERFVYEQRGREGSTLTIPSLIPPAGANAATILPSPYQSVGARGVNNLAAKLLLTLFPPGYVFFRLGVKESVMADLMSKAAEGDDVETEIQTALSKVEVAIAKKLGAGNLRIVVFEAFKHLIVSGNALLVVLPDATFKFFPITRYCVKRDLDGNAVEILTKEALSRSTLPPAALAIVNGEYAVERQDANTSDNPTNNLDLYTWIRLQENASWGVHQEISGQIIPGTDGQYPKGKSAWIPLRWAAVPNEDYGRGHVEEYIGDLYALESLSQSLVEGAAALARLLFLVDEAGVTSKKRIAEAPNLAVIDGNAKDVTVLRTDKAMDFSVSQKHAETIEQRLSQAFLLASSIQRQAERVTAEEIRVMAGELEQGLGGVYSMFAQELQLPLIERVMLVMQKAKELPQFPEKAIEPQIVTGMDGLGRSDDLARLDQFLENVTTWLGPNAIQQYINAGDYMRRRAAALSLKIDGLVKTDDEVQAEAQQAAQAQMAKVLGPAAIQAGARRDILASQRGPEDPARADPNGPL